MWKDLPFSGYVQVYIEGSVGMQETSNGHFFVDQLVCIGWFLVERMAKGWVGELAGIL